MPIFQPHFECMRAKSLREKQNSIQNLKSVTIKDENSQSSTNSLTKRFIPQHIQSNNLGRILF